MTFPRLLAAAAALLFPLTGAAAEQRTAPDSDPRLVISYSPDSDSYCIRSRYVDPTLPSGVRPSSTCLSQRRWASEGVIVSHRLVPAAVAVVAR